MANPESFKEDDQFERGDIPTLGNQRESDIPQEQLDHLMKIGVLAEDLECVENDSEDEGIEDYKEGGYHPVFVGECLIGRYVVLQKLGWGHFSTVWLCKDIKFSTYVAIKIQKSASHYLEAAFDEVEILQKAVKHSETKEWFKDLNNLDEDRRNDYTREDCYTVQLLNAFIYQGPYGKHFCMVFEILGVNLLEIIKRYKYKGIPINICRKMARQILIGLHYLHKHCGIIHTDLKPENVLLCLDEDDLQDIITHKQLYKNDETVKRLQNLRDKIDKSCEEIKECQKKESLLEKESQASTEVSEKSKKSEENTKAKLPLELDSRYEHSRNNQTKLLDQNEKNLNFSKKDGVSRVIDSGDANQKSLATKDIQKENECGDTKGEEDKKVFEDTNSARMKIEKSDVGSSLNDDSAIQSQSNISTEDQVDILILDSNDFERELEFVIREENIACNAEAKKKLKKRLKRKMKRHQKRWKKMTVSEKQQYELVKEQAIIRHRCSFNLKDDSNVQFVLSHNSNDTKELNVNSKDNNESKFVSDNMAQLVHEYVPKYNERAEDLTVGLKSNFKLKIADLGNGCWTHYHFQPEIQTRQYRGPEVILGINYNATADLWSFACMIFEMLTGDFLFDPKKSNDFKKNDDHLAQMIELLNEFPKDWSTIGTHSKRYFDKDGKLKKIKTLRYWGLKDILIQRYKMAEHEAIAFEDFLLPMLTIRPQERATAEQMINHYWLDMPGNDFKNKDPTMVIQNDEERFQKIINESDEYADISTSYVENEFEEEEDDDHMIEGKIFN